MPERKLDSEEVYMTEEPSRTTAKDASANVLSLPVSIAVSVGSMRITMRDLLGLKADTILKLDAAIDDPVQLMIGEKIIATGELVEKEGDEMAVRIIALAGGQSDVQ